MAHHELKIEDRFFEEKKAGNKPFEIRINDREFQKGDTITYTNPGAPYFKKSGKYEITYVSGYNQREGWVVFGDRLIIGD